MLVAATVLLSACYKPLAQAVKAADPTMRPWWCHSELMPDDMAKDWYLAHGYAKGDLSWDDCLQVSADFDAAFTYAQQWPTRGAAGGHGVERTGRLLRGPGHAPLPGQSARRRVRSDTAVVPPCTAGTRRKISSSA